MSGDQSPTPLSKRQQRFLRMALPLGVGLLVLWVVWVVAAVVLQPAGSGVSWASAAVGLVTSLGIIITGYASRRDLDRRKSWGDRPGSSPRRHGP